MLRLLAPALIAAAALAGCQIPEDIREISERASDLDGPSPEFLPLDAFSDQVSEPEHWAATE